MVKGIRMQNILFVDKIEDIVIQYNTVKPKTFKPNLLDELKDISSDIFFSLSLLFLNRNFL